MFCKFFFPDFVIDEAIQILSDVLRLLVGGLPKKIPIVLQIFIGLVTYDLFVDVPNKTVERYYGIGCFVGVTGKINQIEFNLYKRSLQFLDLAVKQYFLVEIGSVL